MPRTTRPKPAIYQMKVTLKGTRPPIWRRFQVRADISLGELHNVLQAVMGWDDEHLHSFRIGQREFGVPDPEWGDEDETQDEERAVLGKVMTRAGTKLRYEYDFGDGWEHEVLLEKVLPIEEGKRYPVCLAGRRRCPLEDCGGVWGWANLIEAVADPNHPDHEELTEWAMQWTDERPLDPEAFDLDAVNRALQRFERAKPLR